ncbi:MAG: hypothetical protein IKK75_06685 [Clostridia bacterium]|nr:hypothetical protein [Clostridia bacterium]
MKAGLSRLPVWIILACAAVLLALMTAQQGDTDASSTQERRIAEVLSTIQGAGKVEVALYFATADTGAFSQAKQSAPTGAVVVAEGAGNLEVRLNLIRAMRTLLSLPENAVDVFVMEEKE